MSVAEPQAPGVASIPPCFPFKLWRHARLMKMTVGLGLARCAAASVAWVAMACGVSPAADLEVERLDPPAVSCRGELTVQAVGELPEWPCRVVSDYPGLEITAAEESGQLSVKADAQTPPGVAWIRLAGKSGASRLLPLLVDRATVVTEAEPNDGADEAKQLALPVIACGRLEKRGDVDAFRLSGTAGETLVISVVANRIFGSPMDAVLQLCDDRGNVLAQADDDRGLDPQLVFHVSKTRELLVRLFAFPETATSSISFAGGDAFQYAVRVTSGPFVDHVEPIAAGADAGRPRPVGWNLPKDATLQRIEQPAVACVGWAAKEGIGWGLQPLLDATATVVEPTAGGEDQPLRQLPVILSGRARSARQVDRVWFTVTAGKRYRAVSSSKSLGYLFDPVLRLVDPQNGKAFDRDDDQSRTDFEAKVEFKAEADGVCELQVFDAVEGHGPRHAYAVAVDEVKPSLELTVERDHITLPAGGTVDVPVTVRRGDGFDAAVTVSAESLPAGVTASPAESQPKGDSSKSVTVRLNAEAGSSFQGPIRLVARLAGSEGRDGPVVAEATCPLGSGLRGRQFWLTVAAQP